LPGAFNGARGVRCDLDYSVAKHLHVLWCPTQDVAACTTVLFMFLLGYDEGRSP
jgi:hypothetical protein